ncbi:polyprenyl synthetase family protein [Streptomyces sp. BE133]|uniref:polyprenyl synthetase family protein n=1 Tax=Streptomyces sp. BE133 TaxID=3002523 RepID=UPI002E79B3ED|nr:polyprenyl synthetase family protein [Streptomyces sp. BE133]MEE1807528.1 polyprenyl synthetase family protein [Streptomyces sp. BE133]
MYSELGTGSRVADEIFDAGGKIIDPAVRSAVERLPEPLLDAARYHYGWAGKDGTPVTGQIGGVGRRGLVLPLLCAGVDGGPAERGLAAVVVGDLLVNASIIHDDVLDRDPVRRGRPALWAAYGTECALMVGDALLGLAFSLLGEQSHPRTHQALRMMSDGWSRLCAGQVRDTGQEGRTGTSLEEAVAVNEAKAADGLRGVFCLPVLFTDATSEQVETVGRYGFHFGMAAQYHNDVTDVWPTLDRGRAPGGDIRRRKMTPMVTVALSSGHCDSALLAAYYDGRGEPGEEEVAAVAELIDRCGGRAWAVAQNLKHMRLAAEHLHQADPPPALYDDLLTAGARYLA